MITKAELLERSIAKFTQFGSKHVTLSELSNELGISKKTIYKFFDNKEDLIACGVESLFNKYREDINEIIASHSTDPVLSVILIYKRGFQYLRYFKPSFLFGLEKYYPKANRLFEAFVEELANSVIYNLLKQAQDKGNIIKEVNLRLVVKIYFFRIDNLVFKENNLFESYQKEDLFKHMVIYNLKGIISDHYSNSYFE